MIENDIKSVKVLESSFITSASSIKNAPASSGSEVAILGRSNVGKSSIINLLLNHKLAKSSSAPGKTKLINFFKTNLEITLESKDSKIILPLTIIDFPGFGYAKVDKKTRNEWDKNLSDFIKKRTSIKLFCHLIDSRHRDLQIDSNIYNFLESILQNQQRFDCNILQIYTKNDKLKKNELNLLRKENKISISCLKKDSKDLVNLYSAIIKKALGYSL